MTVDLSFLPRAARDGARVDGWEVSWAVEDAPGAVDALARSRKVVLSLELLEVDDHGGWTGTPWSIFEPDPEASAETNTAAARHAAQAALERVPGHVPWVAISWE